MCREFNSDGVMAAVFTANTTETERKAILTEYRKPDSMIRVLLSVEALAKGFNVPDVECICDVRPLRKSLSTFMQLFGRGMRSSPLTGKTECLLLDFSGNYVRFMDDFTDIYYNGLNELDAGDRLDATIRRDDEEREIPSCPECGYTPCGKRCISCGHERRPAPVAQHLPGHMEEIVIGKQRLADNREHLYQQICTWVKCHGKPETASKRAWYLFQSMSGGIKPRTSWQFEYQPNVPISRAVINHIKRNSIAYHRTRRV
jgi:hypothetical protein